MRVVNKAVSLFCKHDVTVYPKYINFSQCVEHHSIGNSKLKRKIKSSIVAGAERIQLPFSMDHCC